MYYHNDPVDVNDFIDYQLVFLEKFLKMWSSVTICSARSSRLFIKHYNGSVIILSSIPTLLSYLLKILPTIFQTRSYYLHSIDEKEGKGLMQRVSCDWTKVQGSYGFTARWIWTHLLAKHCLQMKTAIYLQHQYGIVFKYMGMPLLLLIRGLYTKNVSELLHCSEKYAVKIGSDLYWIAQI